MTTPAIPPIGARSAAASGDTPHVKLRKAAQALEGVFLSQLFRAMRATVPSGAGAAPGVGREVFTSLLDDELAQRAAERLPRGLGEALYRQLSAKLPPEEAR